SRALGAADAAAASKRTKTRITIRMLAAHVAFACDGILRPSGARVSGSPDAARPPTGFHRCAPAPAAQGSSAWLLRGDSSPRDRGKCNRAVRSATSRRLRMPRTRREPARESRIELRASLERYGVGRRNFESL